DWIVGGRCETVVERIVEQWWYDRKNSGGTWECEIRLQNSGGTYWFRKSGRLWKVSTCSNVTCFKFNTKDWIVGGRCETVVERIVEQWWYDRKNSGGTWECEIRLQNSGGTYWFRKSGRLWKVSLKDTRSD
nr:hypothetical protein [Tanacetum cinerariifolium]